MNLMKQMLTVEGILLVVVGWHLWSIGQLDWTRIEYLIFVVVFVDLVVKGIVLKWTKQI